MRDPNRIDYYCDRLANLWNKVPDWRFGQLMMNIISAYCKQYGHNMFYPEDDEFFKFADKYIKEITND